MQLVFSAVLGVVAIGLQSSTSVNGHGLLLTPKPRNFAEPGGCQHCLNGGGTGTVKANDLFNVDDWSKNYPETPETSERHGLCGDAANGEQVFLQAQTPVATYVEGQSIDITVFLDTHHAGWFEFLLCDNSVVTQECLNRYPLERDPADPSISPVDSRFLGRYYTIPKCHPDSETQTMRYKLPAGVSCAHCVLQWYWVTANSCHGGGYEGVDFPETFVGSDGRVKRYDDTNDCPPGDGGSPGWYPRLPLESSDCRVTKGYPEEFWNCADISIARSDGSTPTLAPVDGVSPVASPTPKPSTDGGGQANCPGGIVPDGTDCSSAPGCCGADKACYRKNQYWAGCLASCSPGTIDTFDDLPWACTLLSSGDDDDAGSGQVEGCGADTSLPSAVSQAGFANTHGKLKLSGRQLVAADGTPVQLVGMSSHGLHYFPQCYNKESIQFLAENWGINVFRAAVYVGEGGYGDMGSTERDNLVAQLDNIVKWCEEIGIYVIIDWHVLTPGDPNEWLDSVGASSGLAIDFWRQMANAYKEKPHVLYEIANEPNGVSWARVKQYHDAVIGEIRKIDTETIVLAGTPTWSQDIHLAAADPVAQPRNVMYAFHFYSATHSSLLQRVRDHADTLPIFVTEWGTSEASGNNGPNLDVAKQFLDLFKEKGISWAQWSYADKDETSAALAPGACSSKSWDSTSCSGTFIKNFIKRSVVGGEPTTPRPSTVQATPAPSPTAGTLPETGSTADPIQGGNGALIAGAALAGAMLVVGAFFLGKRQQRVQGNKERRLSPIYHDGEGQPYVAETDGHQEQNWQPNSLWARMSSNLWPTAENRAAAGTY